jgi:hypothetical protein
MNRKYRNGVNNPAGSSEKFDPRDLNIPSKFSLPFSCIS